MTTPQRKLGRVQQGVLRAINDHGVWPSTRHWHGQSTTAKVLNSLARRDLSERLATQNAGLLDRVAAQRAAHRAELEAASGQ